MAAARRKKGTRRIVRLFLLLLFLAVIGFAVRGAVDLYYDFMYPRQYTEIVEKYSRQYGVDEDLIYAVIKTESGFRPEAVSSENAKGLMQITGDTFTWLSTKMGEDAAEQHDDLFEPDVAVRYGAFFLSYLQEEFGGRQEMLAAYHAGRGITNEWLSDPKISLNGKTLDYIPYSDTAHYVKKVTNAYEIYQKR